MACDCYGVVCVTLTYLLIAFLASSLYYIEIIILPATSNTHLILFGIVVFMIIWAHLQSTLRNPGYMPKNYKQLDPDLLPLELTEVIEKAMNETTDSSSQVKVAPALILGRKRTGCQENAQGLTQILQ
eukprot:TRINITY_DN16686_c0_g1_i1.p2 TRINITY_DN16686_c0_g1~~TRINITY_DN16686_c0_g1_i1.p2  ORF type:complete len:128 (+),score=11.61 TRINITY_DN16686_c0_g1_i1:137-520(+)